jgi:hypothetical protein
MRTVTVEGRTNIDSWKDKINKTGSWKEIMKDRESNKI